MFINPIKTFETYEWLKRKHYLKRIPPISFAFGLFDDNDLIGVITYGVPVSSSLRRGICGDKYRRDVLELNRLCLENNGKNQASYLISQSLKLLPKPKIVVSYADTAQKHVGYVYQATNFIYTGLSAKRTNWQVRGKEHFHSQHITDEFRGQPNRSKLLREKYADDFYTIDRSRKHRYVYFCGNKKQKRQMKDSLNYSIEPYPKGESRRYDSGEGVPTQRHMF